MLGLTDADGLKDADGERDEEGLILGLMDTLGE